jgi:hypothetical protein
VERELDEIKVAYLEALEAGMAPVLEEVVARHPQYRDELVDFITTLMELERAVDRAPEPPEPSPGIRRLREKVVRTMCGAETLREALADAGLSRERVAAAINVPVSFILRVERGRLIPDGERPVDPKFVARLGEVLRRTTEEMLEILRATFVAPTSRSTTGHFRGTGQPTAGNRPAAQSFRDLLVGCEDLTPAQRREWLSK